MLKADEISARIGSNWPAVLERIGIQAKFLAKRHGPCPACAGTDRFRFTNRRGRGDFYCNGCGPGSGFDLVARVIGCDFATARKLVLQAAGFADQATPIRALAPAPVRSEPTRALSRPTRRVLSVLRESCAIECCDPAIDYLLNRFLWPLPPGCNLRAHSSTEYWDDGIRIGRYPALIAEVRDLDGDLVTAHVTFLEDGKKLEGHVPRKLLSPLENRQGCAVRLQPLDGDTLGIAEGIETAMAAALIHKQPVWAALNTSLLMRFIPPESVKRLVIFADHDVPGLDAGAQLMQRLQGQVSLELKAPRAPAKDWADVLVASYGTQSAGVAYHGA